MSILEKISRMFMDWLYVVLMTLLYLYGLLFFWKRKVIFENKDILNYKGQIIFVSNHVRYFDPFVIPNTLPFFFSLRIWPVKVFTKNQTFKNFWNPFHLVQISIFKIVLFLFQCVMIPREGSKEDKLSGFQREIDLGYYTLFFPEGKMNMFAKQRQVEILDIKEGISILRKNNPKIPFVFFSIKYEKVKFLPLYWVTLSVSDLDFTQSEDYQSYVKNKLQNLIDKTS